MFLLLVVLLLPLGTSSSSPIFSSFLVVDIFFFRTSSYLSFRARDCLRRLIVTDLSYFLHFLNLSSLNPLFLKDDVAPALDGDWREFRAKLVASQATAELPDEQIDVEQLQQQMQGAKTNNQEEEKRKTTKSGYGIIDDAIDNVKIESPEERERREREATEANLELLKTQNPELAKDKAWAHVIAKPEKGSLIVAATDDFVTSQQYFNQCVILLLEHSKDGSMGVILNRPTMYKMADVVNDENGPFSENALYFGGDVGDGTVSFLHGSPDVADAEEVSPGVYIGGFNDAGRLVKEGKKDPREFKFFARYCGWAPGQLEDECDRGVWYPVACSRQIALKPVIALPKPLWREVLELCGGELALKAKRAYAAEDEN